MSIANNNYIIKYRALYFKKCIAGLTLLIGTPCTFENHFKSTPTDFDVFVKLWFFNEIVKPQSFVSYNLLNHIQSAYRLSLVFCRCRWEI